MSADDGPASVRRRARQFDAIFDDPQTYTWILDPDGTLRRANPAALASVDAEAEDLVDRPLPDLPWWSHSPDARERLRAALDRAADGETVRFEVDHRSSDGRELSIDFSVHPAIDESGAVTSLVATGIDITERTELERELRTSEELHRVTLNNMTDTVLVTDDEGRFTYVCPNVHFIFGYTDEQIREMGTIDALLGEDLFDPAELAAEGFLSNVECTATDEAGEEHALLVNVRRVSIQGGTTLYSCRDITKRKQRERALAALQRTSRDLLYAETRRDIARRIVDDVEEVLALPAAAVYLFDDGENVLEPASRTDALSRVHGPLRSLGPGESSIIGTVFVEGDPAVYDDVHRSDALADPETDLRSGLFVPLGEHGVLVAGSADVGAFDEITEELADLFAAAAEAALDRVEREATLRERDRELKRRNRELSRLNRVNGILREVDQALIRAETREEVERAVCERLTDDDRFAFAWIGDADGDGAIRPRAWAGTEQDYLDSVSLAADAAEPGVAAADAREVTVVSNVADGLREEDWRTEAFHRDFQSVASVPIAYDDFAYGVLTVYADRPGAFDDLSGPVLGELGETIASAIGSIERKNALLSDAVVELEYEIRDSKSVFRRLARAADCSLRLEGGVQQSAEGVLAFVSVEGAPVARVLEVAAESISVEGAREVVDSEDGGLVRLRLSRPFIATTLADHGASLRSLEATPDAVRIVVAVPESVAVREVNDVLSSTFPDSALVARRERTSASTDASIRSRFFDRLTDRQLEVVRTAYHGGYFRSPRAQTGEEIAAVLDISPPAFYKHVRVVQRKLFATLFEDALPTGADR